MHLKMKVCFLVKELLLLVVRSGAFVQRVLTRDVFFVGIDLLLGLLCMMLLACLICLCRCFANIGLSLGAAAPIASQCSPCLSWCVPCWPIVFDGFRPFTTDQAIHHNEHLRLSQVWPLLSFCLFGSDLELCGRCVASKVRTDLRRAEVSKRAP